MSNTSVIYANAIAQYNEGKLLDSDKIRRLMDADFSSCVKMLCDYGYGGGIINESSYDIDKFISEETTKLLDFVITDSPNKYLTECLVLKFYYSNVKVLYKNRYSPLELKTALYTLEDSDKLISVMADKNYSELADNLSETLIKLDTLSETQTLKPSQIDNEINACYFKAIKESAKKCRNKSLQEFITSQIDLNNVLTIARSKAIGYSSESVSSMIIDGGIVSGEDVLETLKMDGSGVKNVYFNTPYFDMVEKLCDSSDMIEFENSIDEYLYCLLNKNLDNMTSFAPFIHYFMAQLQEFKAIKTILVCVKNNAKDKIAARIARWLW